MYMDHYTKQRTDQIAKLMRLDPRKEWLASRLYTNSYSWCHCREDHDVNPPCGTVKRMRETVDMLLTEAVRFGLVTGITTYEIPPEPKYKWEEDTLEDFDAMDDGDYAEFIHAMSTEELDDFIVWKREQRRGK